MKKYFLLLVSFIILFSFNLVFSLQIEKLNTDTLKKKAIVTKKGLSALQLETKSKLTLKLNTFLSYFKEYSNIKLDLEHLDTIKRSSESSPDKKVESDVIYAYYDPKKTQVEFSDKEDKDHVLVAKGVYDRTRYQNGWDKLYIKTFEGSNPIIQCWTAGFIEGVLTSQEIYYYYQNLHVFFHGQYGVMEDIKKFYAKVDQKMNRIINKESFEKLKDKADENETQHWSYISCLNAQLHGLHEGYNAIVDKEKQLTLLDFYLINSEGNFSDLKTFMKINNMKISPESKFYTSENLKRVYDIDNIEKIWQRILRGGHCSALVKLVKKDDGSLDMISGHNTWSEYCEMMRSLKIMDWAFEGGNQIVGMKPRKLNYSSYPGVLFSGDDFYEIDSKVVLLQTTLSALNKFIYKDILDVEKYIPEFMRIMISNLISETGAEWAENYSSYKNHMYITQWIVLDYKVLQQINSDKKITGENFLKKNSYKGLIHLVEEVPGSVLYEDITDRLLKNTYFGSFNLAYYPQHQKLLGLNDFEAKDFTSKTYNPRYYILEKLHQSVKNTDDFIHLIQYNGFKKKNPLIPDDPSYQSADNGISARSDLASDDLTFSGGIDFKVVNNDLVNKLSIYAYGGPTYDSNPNLSPFDFNKMTHSFLDKYHYGIPKVWNFKPFEFSSGDVKS